MIESLPDSDAHTQTAVNDRGYIRRVLPRLPLGRSRRPPESARAIWNLSSISTAHRSHRFGIFS
jgi:hypothetical protein